MKELNHTNGCHRVIAFLDRRALDYLDKVGKDALFSTGYKLSRVKIIKAAIDTLMKLDISGKRIDSIEGLEKEILERIKRFNSNPEEEL